MKYWLSILSIFVQISLFAQSESQPITPQILLKIKSEVEKTVPALKDKLIQQEKNKDEIEFSIDTFRIARVLAKRMEIDDSTKGMNNTVNLASIENDKLLNKYYSKLTKVIKEADKKTLVAAQRAWMAYRDAEYNLIGTMSSYTEGGEMQSNLDTEARYKLTEQRMILIFNYYNACVKE